MKKIYFIIKHIKEIYGIKKMLFFYIPSLLISAFPRKEEIFEPAFSLFTAFIVVEIAFIAIFYSGSNGVERAKNFSINNTMNKKTNFYHYLLVKNFHSLFLKFIVLFLIFLMKIYKINGSIKIFLMNVNFGYDDFIFSLIIYSIIITLDLMVSMYYFLWGNIIDDKAKK